MTTLQKWGNSLAIRIPKTLADQIDATDGTEVELSVRGNELVVRPRQRARLSLKELLKECRPSQLHSETDFGEDVGREALE
ncbi:MAG: AbrB/MazE/SpoVT family DNA-binding domain-containing protein [Planctomycetales bacterium]|nr:AbrB/MazE/SpoVT family DNA-binding domain-containing protein [Planctomycetales bacterium]